MKQRCPQCEAWSAEGVRVCPCGRPFDDRRPARIYRQPPATTARIHQHPVAAPDPSYVNTLRMDSQRDLRQGALTIAVLVPLAAILAVSAGIVSVVVLIAVFWAVIRIIRGFRLRREAWEAEHFGPPS